MLSAVIEHCAVCAVLQCFWCEFRSRLGNFWQLDVNDATQAYIDVFKLRVTLLFIIDDILFLTHNFLSVINKLHLMYDFFQSFSWLPNPGTKKTKKTQSYYFFIIFPHLSDARIRFVTVTIVWCIFKTI